MFRVPGICLIHGSWFSSICWKSWSLLRMEMHRLKMQCRSLTFQVFHLPSLPHLKDFNQNLVAKLADIIQSGPLLAINEVIIPLISGFWTKPQWNPQIFGHCYRGPIYNFIVYNGSGSLAQRFKNLTEQLIRPHLHQGRCPLPKQLLWHTRHRSSDPAIPCFFFGGVLSLPLQKRSKKRKAGRTPRTQCKKKRNQKRSFSLLCWNDVTLFVLRNHFSQFFFFILSLW